MLHTHAAHTNTRDDYVTILVFDLEDDNTTGTLPIHPYVEETDEIPCENVEKPQTPHKSDDNTRILICKYIHWFFLVYFVNFPTLRFMYN